MLGILGTNYIKTTNIFDYIVNNTDAKTDQEHIKINIIINNKLFSKSIEEQIEYINKLELINTTYLILDFDNKDFENLIKNNSNIKIINIDDVFKLHKDGVL